MEEARLLKKLGRAIHAKRIALGYSQERLAELADCHRNFIGMIERGERNITVIKLRDIAAALKTTVSELTEGIR
jgi:transcriptional regulator with XRE-family HTH domain